MNSSDAVPGCELLQLFYSILYYLMVNLAAFFYLVLLSFFSFFMFVIH